MKWIAFAYFSLSILFGCKKQEPVIEPVPQKPFLAGSDRLETPDPAKSLVQVRQGFKTQLRPQQRNQGPVPQADPRVLRTVKYDSPVGKLGAYITPDPKDSKKHPAIVWIHGGDCSFIDDDIADEGEPDNDQSASAYRKAGIVMMFPSLRGGNDNPGNKEGFLGEVDDVIAAASFLAKQDYVDPKRIYLGGHSTGGTLVMLVAECSDRFRGVFSFGPADNVAGYPDEFLPFNRFDPKEVQLRSPGDWLHSIQSSTYVFEGTSRGNLDSLQTMARNSRNPKSHFYPVRGGDHFSILDPVNRLIAQKILRDTEETSNITFTEAEVNQAMRK